MDTSLSRKREKKLMEEVVTNDGLLLKILERMPAKSLMRFMCVSTRWLCFISDSKFCAEHTKSNPKPSVMGVHFYHCPPGKSERIESVSLHDANCRDLPTLTFLSSALEGMQDRSLNFGEVPKIWHACNGLFLCSYDFGQPFIVCNPTTKKFTALPELTPPACTRYHGDHGIRFAFLDFAPSFKVVLVCLSCSFVHVYSSDSETWKRVEFQLPNCPRVKFMALWNGAIHWVMKEKFHVRFEIEAEELISNEMPPSPKILNEDQTCYFGECFGHLFLVQIPRLNAEKGFSVFEMENDYSGWTVKWRVNLRQIIASFPESFEDRGGSKMMAMLRCRKVHVLSIVKEDERSDFLLLLAIQGKVISLNLKNKRLKVLREFPREEFPLYTGSNNPFAFPCSATLAPV